jgi:2-polyprenyl-6-methoxyphenol hydroxylase-like FAD-dependent oxidoreductase
VTAGDRHAVVAGAGIGGAAAALLLANAGWRVTLFERVAEPRAVGAEEPVWLESISRRRMST